MFGKPPVGVLPTPDKSSTATEQPVPALWRDDIIDGGGLSYPNMTDRVQQQQEAVAISGARWHAVGGWRAVVALDVELLGQRERCGR